MQVRKKRKKKGVKFAGRLLITFVSGRIVKARRRLSIPHCVH